MSKGITSKTRLLLGASTLLLASTAGMAADNVTISNNITLAADATQSTKQTNNDNVNPTSGTGVDNVTGVGNTTDSSVTVDANSNRAIAIGNTGTQSLGDADSAATETSVALGLKQLSESTGQTNITVGATASSSDVTLTTGAVSGSSATLSNSTNAASATTNTASQTVVLKSTTLENTIASVAADATDTSVTATATSTGIAGDVAVGSAQATTKSITNATNATSTFTLTAASDVEASALKLMSNTQDATATGSTATNAVGLSATTVNIGAAIVSQQSSDTASDVTATTAANIAMNLEDTTAANPSATPAVLAGTADLTDSSAMVSGNRIQAKASDGVTSNLLTVDATDLNGANGTTTEVDFAAANGATSTSAFTVANQQVAADNAVAAGVTASGVTFDIDGETSGSSVAVESNVIDAFALSNKSTNSLSLAGTTVATDAGVINRQSSTAAVSSTIGEFNNATPVEAVPVTLTAEFEDGITGSSVAVNSNVTRGSAIGNVGNNTLTASATTLSGVGATAQAVSAGDSTTGEASATGDFSVVNSQALVSGASSDTLVLANYGIDVNYDDLISDSRLSVSSNTQFAEALGNSGTNRIALTATGPGANAPAGVNPTAALSNVQDGDAVDIDSESGMSVFANAASTGSSVAINGNSNTALGVVNNAVNSIAVSAVTLTETASDGGILSGTNTTTADYALNSVQGASGTVDSNATSTIYNQENTVLDVGDATTIGTRGSVITLTGNMTTAEGSANRIQNQVSVSATDNGATAALNNSQTSSTIVNSTANSSVGYLLTTASTDINASASSISVDGNSTMALARGNSASNALNYNVGASYSAPTTAAAVTGITSVDATAAVLNAQTNDGNVTASSNSTSYALVLNSGTGAAALNSNATLANNSVAATAFGNVASNSLNMTTFGAGVPSSALASNQVNTGAVSATATNVSFSMTVGTTQGSALRNVGNNTTAQAVGNSSVNSMNGGN
jgi:hypothetical protein